MDRSSVLFGTPLTFEFASKRTPRLTRGMHVDNDLMTINSTVRGLEIVIVRAASVLTRVPNPHAIAPAFWMFIRVTSSPYGLLCSVIVRALDFDMIYFALCIQVAHKFFFSYQYDRVSSFSPAEDRYWTRAIRVNVKHTCARSNSATMVVHSNELEHRISSYQARTK